MYAFINTAFSAFAIATNCEAAGSIKKCIRDYSYLI
jgi:hypothetical protein